MKPQRFSKDSLRRIAEQTRRGEQTPRFPVGRGQGQQPYGPCVLMEVTTQVTLRVGNVLGKGMAKRKIVTYDASDVATTADHPDTTSYPLYSGATVSGQTIAVGRLVIAACMYGRFHAVVDFCMS